MPDIAQLRRETPGIQHRIHFNNAGAALMPAPVIRAIRGHLELEARIGGYEAAAERRADIEAFYECLAAFLHAHPRNVAYAGSATDAYERALSSIPFEKGDLILTTRDDYVSNQIAFLQLRRRFGVEVVRAANLPEGGVDPDDMRRLLDRRRPRLVALTHVPTNSGLVQPAAEVGRLCQERKVTYLVDACQSAGQLTLDVEALHCDFLSATFRKFLRGPRGAGFLFVSDRVLSAGWAPLFLDLHSADWTAGDAYEPAATARRFERWERPYALLLGARAAVDYARQTGLPFIESRVKQLAALTRAQLADLPGIRILDRGTELAGIVTLHHPGLHPHTLQKALDDRRINTSLIFRESVRFDFADKGVDWALRISPHYYNTEEEIETLTDALRTIV